MNTLHATNLASNGNYNSMPSSQSLASVTSLTVVCGLPHKRKKLTDSLAVGDAPEVVQPLRLTDVNAIPLILNTALYSTFRFLKKLTQTNYHLF